MQGKKISAYQYYTPSLNNLRLSHKIHYTNHTKSIQGLKTFLTFFSHISYLVFTYTEAAVTYTGPGNED